MTLCFNFLEFTMVDLIPVKSDAANRALYTKKRYEEDYRRSIDDPDGFWKDIAARLEWVKAPTKIKNVSFRKEDFRIRWYEDGELNAAVNCIDRHLPERANETAII